MKPLSERRGIIASSGGGALIAATECLKTAGRNIDWVVITDRDCGAYHWAKAAGYETHRLEYSDAQTFSTKACEIFESSACTDVLLFYTRRVASPLIDSIRVWNIHPALLPAFPGLRAVEQALRAQVRVLGATLHRVDAELDRGPIVAQVATHLPLGTRAERAHRISYLQKVWLAMVWVEQTSPHAAAEPEPNARVNRPSAMLASPELKDANLHTSYTNWVAQTEMGSE
jgi:phosphoribosylglycinamide formyltransferase 1